MATNTERITALETKLKNSGKGVRKHGTNADATRPQFASVEWQGTVAPKQALDGDTWLVTS